MEQTHLEENIDISEGGFPGGWGADSPYRKWPQPVGSAIIDMLQEPPINSADELVHLLEVWLRHIGLLWMASYLRGRWHDSRLDRLLFSMLLDGERDLSVGAWAYLGSQIFHTYRRHGWDADWPRLSSFDYGDPRDEESRLSRLLRYRNSFAHGSFQAALQDILEHRRCLWEMIAAFDALREAPILFWESGQQRWCCMDLDATLWEGEVPNEVQQDTLYWRVERGRWFTLSPFWSVQPKTTPALYASHPFHLVPFSLSEITLAEREAALSAHPQIAAHLQRYQSIRMGDLDSHQTWDGETLEALHPDTRERILERLRGALSKKQPDKPNFVLVSAYPGSGKSALVGQADTLFSGFDQVLRYRVDRHTPSLSGRTFARYLLRKLEPYRAKDDGSEEITSSPEEALHRAFAAFARHNKRLLVCIDRFHLAYESFQKDPSIYEILSNIRGEWASSLCFLLAARTGYRDHLMYDTVIELPPVEFDKTAAYPRLLGELGLLLDDPDTPYPPDEVRLRRHLLRIMAAKSEAVSVFSLCDRLHDEADRGVLDWTEAQRFSPHIERIIWELRPILRCETRQEADGFEQRLYQPFCGGFARYLASEIAYGGGKNRTS